VIATKIKPKRFAVAAKRSFVPDKWNERVFMDWVQGSCKGTAWYDAMLFEPYGYPNNGPSIELNVWFSSKGDAMLFKLSF
jgi:hypothetical protein